MKIKTQLHQDRSSRSGQLCRRIATLLLLLLLLALAGQPASAATLRWTGGSGTSSDWSRGANWDTGTAPANDDILAFPAGAARLANNNDLTGLRVAAIRFTGATGGYTISGNGVVVTDGITANHALGGNTIALARLTLANAMSFVVSQAGVSLTIDSEVRLNGNDLTADATGFLVLRGVVSGTGNVNKIGTGLLTLSGAVGNSFTGNLFANAGTVFLGKTAGPAVTNRLVIGDGLGGAQADIVGMLADNQVSEVTINSSGVWNLGNFANEVSDLVLNQGGDVTAGATGKLRLGGGAGVTVTPAANATPNISFISGNLELSGGTHLITVDENTASVSDGNELVIDAVISGALLGGIIKEGAGDLELRGNNTFGGQVAVNTGELRVGHASALGATGTLAPTTVNNAATLRVLDGTEVGNEVLRLNSTGVLGRDGDPPLRGVGSCAWKGDVVLERDTRIGVSAGGEFTLAGVISGTGNIIKESTGTLRLGGSTPNTFTGDLLVNTGTVELDKGTVGGLAVPGRLIIGDGLGGPDADVVRHRKDNQVNTVTVNSSGKWELGVFQDEVSDLDMNDGGEITTSATGLLRLGIGADVAVTKTVAGPDTFANILGNLELLLGTHKFVMDKAAGVSGAGYLTISAAVSGLGGITKEGPGPLALTHANTFAGAVTVNDGALVTYDPQALGSAFSGTRINAPATFETVFDGTVADESLTLDDTVMTCIKHGVWTGNITLLGDCVINAGSSSTLDSSLELRGVISGAGGLTKIGKDPLTFTGSAANTYAGVTFVNEGRLVLSKTSGKVAVAGALVIGNGTGGTDADVVECPGVNTIGALSSVTVNSSGKFIVRQESIGALEGSGNVSIDNSLTVGDANTTTTFNGVISGSGSVNKHGTGTLTFNGNNTYVSGTGIAGGTLIVNGQQPASFVLIQPGGRLGGAGRAGDVSAFAGGASVAPGSSPGRLTAGNVVFTPGTVFRVELDGPVAGTQHDQLRVFGTVDLGQAELNASLAFAPTLGQPLVIIDNDGADAITDRFTGLQEGDTLRLNQIPFIISYRGGDGNDVTLTATNKSISIASTRVEAGNGNGVIDPNECNHLFVTLMNETAGPLAVSRAVLDSATPGVIITQQESDYANFPALGFRTNIRPFQFRNTADFECGRLVDFLLTLTVSGSGTFTIPFAVPSGSGGVPVRFDNGANLALVDNGGTTSAINVAGAATHIGKVAVSLHITHPSAGDLVLRLRSPSGTTVRLAKQLGGAGDNYGSSCGTDADRTTFDDAAPIRIAAGAAPFVGSFTPEESLAAFLGEDPNGAWQLLIQDTVAGDTGELRCWSLLISPPECSDGGGACKSCVPAFSGRLTADMPSTLTRLLRDGVPSGCGSPKGCPSVTTGPRLFYRVHLVTNSGPATCVSAVLTDVCRTSNLRLHCAAYLGSYDPANPCANYLGDTGTELTAGSTGFSFAAPQDAIIALVVSSPVVAVECVSAYFIQLHGLPCPPPALSIGETGYPDEVRLFWSTAYPDFDLQRTTTLNGTSPSPFVNVPFTPMVVNGDYSVTNRATAPDACYRLSKP